MSQGNMREKSAPVVLVGKNNGITVIPSPTPLTRLHYFDGKFLRARDLELEQTYLRQLVSLSNQAGGSGVVHGFDCDLAGNVLSLGPGLAIDGQGRVLLLPESRDFDLAALIEASRQRYADSLPKPIPFPGRFSACCDTLAEEPGTVSEGATFYLISICHAEALCGEEDVFGKLCAAACQTTTERPYTLEGLVLRALPLDFASILPSSTASPLPITGKHLRSRVAAAYFEDERQKVASLISEGGLKSSIWCHGAAADGASCLPLAMVARAGSQTLFLDAWTVRRERMESPPRRYWAGILAMRPYDVYLAQVLQFQCQLACCLNGQTASEGDPECQRAYELLRRTAEELALMIQAAQPRESVASAGKLDYQQLETLRGRLADASVGATALPRENRLLHCGFVELPSAGYLPIDLGAQQTVNEQVRAMMGGSVDLRFCVVRPDFVPHAFEEAQHMERVSLLYGFDHPGDKPKVDILVPNGQIDEQLGKISGRGYVLSLKVSSQLVRILRELVPTQAGIPISQPGPPSEAKAIIVGRVRSLAFYGAARSELKAGGGLSFYYAGRSLELVLSRSILPHQQVLLQPLDRSRVVATPSAPLPQEAASATPSAPTTVPAASPNNEIWLESELAADPFELEANESLAFRAEVVIEEERDGQREVLRLRLIGELAVAYRTQGAAGPRLGLRLTGSLAIERRLAGGGELSAVANVKESLILDRQEGSGFGAAHALLIQTLNLFGQGLRVEAERTFTAAGRARLESFIFEKGAVEGVEVFSGDLISSAEALDAGNPAHDASISALGLLGMGLGDAGFADSRARRLFPPPKSAPQDLVLRARLPWVLFHRRRDKVCAVDAPVNVVPARRFRLFHIQLPSRDALEVVLALLQKGSSLANYNPQFVATVEFAAGLASVKNAFEPLQDSWDLASEDGGKVVFGAIAGQGQVLSEGETLARARLGALASVLAPITPSDMPDFELLDAIHPDLPANGLDGSIVYATFRPTEIQVVCQAVFLLRESFDERLLAELERLIDSDGVDSQALRDRFGLVDLVTLNFAEGSAAPVAGSIKSLREATEVQAPGKSFNVALTVSRLGNSTADRTLQVARSKALLEGLGGGRVERGLVYKSLPTDCPAVTLLGEVRGA